jgi:hypothetical protein
MYKEWDTSSFDPITIGMLAAALDRASRQAATEAREAYDLRSARNVLAARIIDMANHGERDPARLALGALCHLRQTQQIKASKERVEQRALKAISQGERINGFRESA